MTLMRLITIKYFNRLTALLNTYSELLNVSVPTGLTLEGGGFCGTVL
jgi:hypothetical protein